MSDIAPLLERIRVLAHSAIRIESNTGVVMYFDPFELTEAPHDADIVFVSHSHYDHLSPEDAAKISNERTVVVCPETCLNEARALGAAETIGLRPGSAAEVLGVPVEAVAAYNVQPDRLGFHPRSNGWLGFTVTVDGARCYIAGDTDQNPDNAHVDCDIAFVPVGGTYTMDAVQAAAFVELIQPEAAIPTHYGSAVGKAEDGAAFKQNIGDDISVVLKMEGLSS